MKGDSWFEVSDVNGLKHRLGEIASIDPSRSDYGSMLKSVMEEAYARRNVLVQEAVIYAQRAGLKAGYAVHQPIADLLPVPKCSVDGNMREHWVNTTVWEPQWGVVAFIELPTGQISWHLDSGNYKYDNHSDSDKWKRVSEYIGGDSNE